jgi:putative tricarboxylic transport membrane protein
MVLACALIVIQAMRASRQEPFVDRAKLAPVLKVLWPALAAALMQAIGLYVSSAFYLGFHMRWVSRHSLVALILLSIGFPLATFVIFERRFLVPMP